MDTFSKRKRAHWGVPSFFRCRCFEAAEGGKFSYSDAAWHLSIHLRGQIPDGFDEDEWDREIEGLAEHLKLDDGDAVLKWFDEYYPRCMELVPSRRRQQFLKGVELAYGQRRLGE